MKAALLREVDGPFELVDLPDPSGDGKTLVRVRAAGINFADVLIRRGRYPQMPELPAVVGSEIAGELEDGTRVMAFTGGGGYAELVAVEAAALVPLPEGASFAEGAAFLLTFLTAYIPLTRQVRLREGATVLVYAAAGGVGTAAIQVARALGARVVAAAGSDAKLDVCRELGAEEAYVYDELPDDLQVDVVLDPVGGELFASSFARLRALGTVVAIGSAGGRVGAGRPGAARRPQHRPPGLLPGPPDPARAGARRRGARRAARVVGTGRGPAVRRRRVPSRRRRSGARARRVAPQRRQGRAAAVTTPRSARRPRS